MKQKRKNDELVTPIDALLYSFVDIARFAWKARDDAIRAAMLKPTIILAGGNIRPHDHIVEQVPDLTEAQYLMKRILKEVLRETGLYDEMIALMNIGDGN
jgi:hypothetical protein